MTWRAHLPLSGPAIAVDARNPEESSRDDAANVVDYSVNHGSNTF